MIKINFHMHSTGSDGDSTPEEVIKESIKKRINFICFTDHYKRPEEIETDWDTSGFHSKEYVEDIRNLQKKYESKIDVSYGAEFDWAPDNIRWIKKEILLGNFDFVMGSVHLLFKDKKINKFMFSNQGMDKWLESSKFFGSPKNMVLEYYAAMRDMIKSGLFDSVGHLDVIKIHNKDSIFFSENEVWYRKEVIKTLDLLEKSKMVVEINTSGIGRDVGAMYPSLWILKEAKKRNIPITIGTDAHTLENIDRGLDQAYDLAREAGYKEIVRFKARKMITISI